MTSSMTSQNDLKVVSLYSFMNEKITFLMITEERTNISSSNLVYICIIELWICVYKRSWNASLMTSSSPKISLNFAIKSSKCSKLDWLWEIQVSVSHTDQQILASTQSPIALSFVCLSVCTEISQNLKNDSRNHHQTWSQASISPWFLQVRWTRMWVK